MIRYFIFSLIFLPFYSISQNSLNLSLSGSYTYDAGVECNDIWGYVDSFGNEYALVGLTNGFSVVNLSSPSNPTEEFFIPGAQSIWRDIKVWNNYAYVTCDQGSDGLLIVDLNDMTGNTYVFISTDQNGQNMFTRAHNLYIDEFGKAYIFGGNVSPVGGALILDVTNVDINNNVKPTILGVFDEYYLHDGMARGDTLWGAAINQGNFYAIDVSNPSSPEIFNNGLAFNNTPDNFTHNCWISDDGKTLFTTDEVSGAYLGAYDVSDLNNIYEIDRIQSSPGSGVIPHNTHVDGNFIITSYYRDGITVHDVTFPNNMIEVAYYDMYSGSGDGFDGSWGAYPYLPSGLILSSEINSGPNGEGMLLVLEPSFQQACFLQGNVYDMTGSPIFGANIEILSTNISSTTNLNGFYNTATLNSGNYDVVFSANGYISDTVSANLSNGLITQLDDTLEMFMLGCDNPLASNFNPLATTDFAYVGPQNNNFASGGYFYGNQHLLIDVFEPCIIKSAKFYAENINTITFELRDQFGLVIDDTTHTLSVGEQTLNLNFDVPVGSNLQLGVSSNNSGLYRNNTGANYPYSLSNFIDITESSAGVPGYYYFYYDIKVNSKCLNVPNESWNCTPNGCFDPGDGSGQYFTLSECQLYCQNTGLFEENQTLIFPNPTSNYLNFKNNYFGDYEIKNVLGLVVQRGTKEKENISLNLYTLPSGVYYFSIKNKTYRFIKK